VGPGCRPGRFCPRRPPARRRHQVLDRPRGRACRTDHAPGPGPRSDRPARRRHPAPGPGNRCGRGTRSAPEGRSPQQASHHYGDRGRRKSHAARRAPHGGLRPAGRDRRLARVRDPRPARRPPAWDRTVRAGGPPGNCACPRLGLCPVPDQGLSRPARRARRNRTLRLGRQGARSRGSRCPVHRRVRNRLPSHRVGRTSEALTQPEAQPVRCRTPCLPRASLGCSAGPDSPGLPAHPQGPPACAGPALSRGTAVAGTDAGAGHRGTRVRDRRSHARAAHAAVPAGPRRSSVPLPCL
jgi:hypothetical protein